MVISLAIFAAEVIVLELIRQFTPLRSDLSIALCLGIVVVPLFISDVLIYNKNAFSRTVAVSTMLVLGAIALSFASFPAYLLPLALGVAYAGSRPFLHRKPTSIIRTILYSTCAVLTALLLSFTVAYITTVATRIIASSYPL